MLVVMHNHATPADIERVVKTIEEMGYTARPMPGGTRTTVGLIGNDGRVDGSRVEALPGVAEIIHVSKPYKQVSREWREENTVVTIAPGVAFGTVVPFGALSESERWPMFGWVRLPMLTRTSSTMPGSVTWARPA